MDLFEVYNTSKSVSEVLKKLNLSDNKVNRDKIKNSMIDVNFDINLYKTRKQRYCNECGILLNKDQKKYCSRKCSLLNNNIGRFVSKETKEKISFKLINKGNKDVHKKCVNCNESFIVKWKCRKQKYCSRKCSSQHRVKNLEYLNLLSKKRIESIMNGNVNGCGIKMNYKFKEKYLRCDSKIEYSCLDYFEKKGASEMIRCDFFITYLDNGIKRRFNPDFKIIINNEIFIVEVKSFMSIENINKKWRKYNELAVIKKNVLNKYCYENNYTPFWFTKDLNINFYNKLKIKNLK